MKRVYSLFVLVLLFLFANEANAAGWEKAYVKKSTDCFRNVREVSSGGYVLAGYTANFTPNDTDGLVVRINSSGDTMWTFIYNGPSSKEDLFYRAVPTSDGGFFLAGYSKSFGNGENALYAKLNSAGQLQWVKNWGGSGIEHVQDAIQLSDGKYVMCGYTTSSPAHYYDAFLLKVDGSGNTVFSKIYGGTQYDDANSVKVLPDNGFIMGGQSNNDLYLIRTNVNGDMIWDDAFGTAGIDNIEYVAFAQGGNGFMLAGTTDGIGVGGEDAYLIKTDTAGNQIWAKTYGGSLNDGFHRLEQTSDGGYVGIGTSSEGPWPDPNMWIAKLDASGNLGWQNYFGGNHHDHGYNGQQTSDGGYIVCGHTHSIMDDENNEDAFVIKTNSSGQVSPELRWPEISGLTSPVTSTCGSATSQIKVDIVNNGIATLTSVPVVVEVTGAVTQTFNQTYSGSISPGSTKSLTFTSTLDMSGGGTFNFRCYTNGSNDVWPLQNSFNKSVTVGGTTSPNTTDGSHCGPGTVVLSASSADPLQWFSAPSGGSAIGTGTTFTTPYLFANAVYYVQSNGACTSARVAVDATIAPGLAVPTTTNGSRCGPGSVSLNASSTYTIKWYSSATSTTSLFTGTNYNTPSISTNTTYYVQAENATCSSTRTTINATILSLPSAPNTTPGTNCGNGTVDLGATASNPIEWFDVASGGSILGTGTSFTTPPISTTTTYYAAANNGTCSSTRTAAVATISNTPADPVTTSASRCNQGTVTLTATSASPVKWYDAASGGSQVGSGLTLTTPSISTTTTYWAVANNGCVGNAVPAVATINFGPANPSTTPDSRCGPGTLTLTATSADPVKWFSAATAGTLLGSGLTFITPSITSTKTYYAEADNGCPSTRTATVATVLSLPSSPSVTPDGRCNPGIVTLGASASNPIEWYDAATGGTQVGTGTSFTTPSLATTTTYYAVANNGTCLSNPVTVVATITTPPAAPVTTSASRCGPGTVTLSATSTSSVKWYDAASGGSQVGSGASFTTPAISTTTTYYALADDNGCQGTTAPAVATVNTPPANPVTTPDHRCGPGTLTLTATSTVPVKWWSASTGGTLLFTGLTFITPSITSTKTYYAEADNGCPSNRIATVATVNSLPSNPSVTSAVRCSTGTVNLSASGSSTLEWYDAPTGGTQVTTGSSYTTPVLTTTTSYYVLSNNGTCASSRVTVTATISSTPASPVTTPGGTCGPGTVDLSATASGSTIKWYAALTGGSSLHTGSSFTTPSISTSTTYYAQADNGCISSRSPALASVNSIPSDPVTMSGWNCGSGTVILTANASDPIKWYDAPTGGSQIGSGNTLTTPVISGTTTFYAMADNGPCNSDRVPAVATIYTMPVDPVVTSAELCGDGSLTLIATSADTLVWYDAASGGNVVSTGDVFVTPVLTATTTYYVQASNDSCPGNMIPVDAVINPLPVMSLGPDSTVCFVAPCILDAGPGFANYIWTTNDQTQTVTATASGTYCVTVTDIHNCTASDCAYIDFSVGMNEAQQSGFVSLYPLPTHGFITIENNGRSSQVEFSILDITGQTVLYNSSIANKATIDLSFLAEGVYIARIIDGKNTTMKKLVIN